MKGGFCTLRVRGLFFILIWAASGGGRWGPVRGCRPSEAPSALPPDDPAGLVVSLHSHGLAPKGFPTSVIARGLRGLCSGSFLAPLGDLPPRRAMPSAPSRLIRRRLYTNLAYVSASFLDDAAPGNSQSLPEKQRCLLYVACTTRFGGSCAPVDFFGHNRNTTSKTKVLLRKVTFSSSLPASQRLLTANEMHLLSHSRQNLALALRGAEGDRRAQRGSSRSKSRAALVEWWKRENPSGVLRGGCKGGREGGAAP